ncbi:RNA-binding protein [Viridibacillus sp. YIM B01967]|uniref:RNA-binding protein n=1 Tax=Viridibacillus soli TaxID=2798301 RepID=A0ABS1H592_9BACL|nr:YlmH/Sll1252 family protein [Viridibacillus soli]MBK3494466.1 RNA-binding protein [Viridibacillus soli]
MEQVFQHFRPEEREFIEQVSGWRVEVEDRYAPKLTDFLDPRQQFIVHSLIGQQGDIAMSDFGVFEQAERQRVLLYPSYFEPEEEDYQITVFHLRYPSKFVQLEHPDVLGALLSLGLGRGKFGDIRIAESSVQFAVAAEVEDYVRANLTSIGKVKVHVELLKPTEILFPTEEIWTDEMMTVSSLRLDTVIASVFNISRQKSAALIASGKVKVNFTVRENTAFELHELDLLSIRNFGRFMMKSIEGRTKKDKIRINIGRMERKS